MRPPIRHFICALALVGLGHAVRVLPVAAGDAGPGGAERALHSELTIPASSRFPLAKRVLIGESKSLLVQFPIPLKDVMVADPDKVDAVVQTSQRVFLIGKKQGQTNAFFFDTRGQRILTLEISVGADLEGLDGILSRLVPGSRIRTEMAGSSVILTGSVRTPLDAKRASDIACQFVTAHRGVGVSLARSEEGSAKTPANSSNESQVQQSGCGGSTKMAINLLTIEAEDQVMLKVIVAEMQRSVLKQFGVNLGAAITSGSFSTALLSENALPLTAAAGLGTLATPSIVGGVLNSNVSTNSGISSSFSAGGTQVTGVMRALERNGLVRSLAEPNLTAVSGETAKFLAGGEYPVPMVDSDGKLSVTFKEFGVGLAFTPVVLSEGRISLNIDAEVSELTNDGAVVLSSISIPALKKRKAKSTVELPSGGSLAIAGLISTSTKQNLDGYPGLKDLDVLGTLFRSRDFQNQETELVIIVTPYVVRATSRQNLARPDDGFAPASDDKANLLGHLNRVYGQARELPRGDLKGGYGFIID